MLGVGLSPAAVDHFIRGWVLLLFACRRSRALGMKRGFTVDIKGGIVKYGRCIGVGTKEALRAVLLEEAARVVKSAEAELRTGDGSGAEQHREDRAIFADHVETRGPGTAPCAPCLSLGKENIHERRLNQMERPIVFLDIDGVLNSGEQWYAQAASRKEELNSQPSTPGAYWSARWIRLAYSGSTGCSSVPALW